MNNGRDFIPTNRWVLFGHHFAAIAGAGPLVGPTLAAQFGYLPGTIWIVIGVVLAGAVQDFTILCCSMRRDGKSLGQMAKEEINRVAGMTGMIAILLIMIILLAVLALVVVMLGAWVRLTDAGLGCPDWPGCYGRLVVPHPETSAEELGADPRIAARRSSTVAVGIPAPYTGW